MKKDYWAFTRFTMDFEWREEWKRDNPELRIELMLLANNIDPLSGFISTDRSILFGSRNAWYQWKRYDVWVATGVSNSWSMQLFPTAENPYMPYSAEHMRF